MEQYCAFILTIHHLDIRGRTSNRTEWYCAFIWTIYFLRTANRMERYCAFIPTIYFFVIRGETSNRTERYCAFTPTIYLLRIASKQNDIVHSYRQFTSLELQTSLWYVVKLQTERIAFLHWYWQFCFLVIRGKSSSRTDNLTPCGKWDSRCSMSN